MDRQPTAVRCSGYGRCAYGAPRPCDMQPCPTFRARLDAQGLDDAQALDGGKVRSPGQRHARPRLSPSPST